MLYYAVLCQICIQSEISCKLCLPAGRTIWDATDREVPWWMWRIESNEMWIRRRAMILILPSRPAPAADSSSGAMISIPPGRPAARATMGNDLAAWLGAVKCGALLAPLENQ